MASSKYSLNKVDLIAIGKGLLIALGGAGLVYLADVIPSIDFGPYTPLVVALAAVLINFLRKYLSGPTK